MPAGRRQLLDLHQPRHLPRAGRRVAHLRCASTRRRRQPELGDQLHLVVAGTAAAGTVDRHQAVEPQQREAGGVRLLRHRRPVSFQCSLDGGTYSPCTSPSTTAALADGSHTVRGRGGRRLEPHGATPRSTPGRSTRSPHRRRRSPASRLRPSPAAAPASASATPRRASASSASWTGPHSRPAPARPPTAALPPASTRSRCGHGTRPATPARPPATAGESTSPRRPSRPASPPASRRRP